MDRPRVIGIICQLCPPMRAIWAVRVVDRPRVIGISYWGRLAASKQQKKKAGLLLVSQSRHNPGLTLTLTLISLLLVGQSSRDPSRASQLSLNVGDLKSFQRGVRHVKGITAHRARMAGVHA